MLPGRTIGTNLKNETEEEIEKTVPNPNPNPGWPILSSHRSKGEVR